MRVKTDYEGCEYITAGKEYEVVEEFPDVSCRSVVDDDGTEIIIYSNGTCAHLERTGTWEVVE